MKRRKYRGPTLADIAKKINPPILGEIVNKLAEINIMAGGLNFIPTQRYRVEYHWTNNHRPRFYIIRTARGRGRFTREEIVGETDRGTFATLLCAELNRAVA